ncbi:hypothetical protein BSLG_002830 [Batrachochytrium salamandrivorans]|nr:hypothetical protein BSLG_002830 [Batrachochytrium salamandrivorans]
MSTKSISSATQAKPLPSAFPIVQGIQSISLDSKLDMTAGMADIAQSGSVSRHASLVPTSCFQVVNPGSSAMLRATLVSGEAVLAAVGTIAGTFGHVTSELTVGAPTREALLRRLAGGSLFFGKFSVDSHSQGVVLVAPRDLGDIVTVSLDGSVELTMRQSALLAATSKVEVVLASGGFGLADSGLFNYVVRGKGDVAMTAYGGMVRIVLNAGEEAIINPRNMIAWDSSMSVGPITSDALPLAKIPIRPSLTWLASQKIPTAIQNGVEATIQFANTIVQQTLHQVRYWVIGQRGLYRACGPGQIFLATRLKPTVVIPSFKSSSPA